MRPGLVALVAVLGSFVDILGIGVARGEAVGDPACVADDGYARTYAEIRARWINFGGISSGSIPSDARVRIQAAAVLARHSQTLAAHARLKQAAATRLGAWADGDLDPKSQLAFSVRLLAVQLGKEGGGVAWLARAVESAAAKTKIAEGTRVLDAFLRAHPDLADLPRPEQRDLLERRWGAVPWDERKRLIDASDAIVRELTLEGRSLIDQLALEHDSNGGHAAFLPRMTWFGAGVQGDACPPAADGLLGALSSFGLPGPYVSMLNGRPPAAVARFSRRVHTIATAYREVSCARRLPPPAIRHDAAAARIELDVFTRPASCAGHAFAGLHLSRRGEAYETVQPTADQLRREGDRILAVLPAALPH